MQKYRVSNFGLINKDKKISFKFNNKKYSGFEGDTLASALLANGVTLVARSFKYHRPRGIVTAGSEEPNALVTLFSGAKQEPNVPATMVPLYDGLEAYTQNAFPSVKYDYMAINNYASSILVAGFYYKTFMGLGQKGWHFFEHFIRKAAGQGKASDDEGYEKYDQVFDFCDVLIIGGGVSGLSSALSAGRAGKRVIIVDEKERFGGYGLTDNSVIDFKSSREWINDSLSELDTMDNVMVLPRTVAFGLYDGGNVGCVEKVSDHYVNLNPYTVKQRMHNITAEKIILATGAIERPLVFSNNDLPNVMQSESLNTYIQQYGVCSGNKVVIFTNNDSAYRTVQSLIDSGKNVTVVDVRNVDENILAQNIVKQGVNVIGMAFIKQVNGNKTALKSVRVIDSTGKEINIECDLVASSGGHTPVVNLWSHLYGKPVYDENICAFLPNGNKENLTAVGACIGRFDLQECLDMGYEAGGDKNQQSAKVTNVGFATVQVQKIEPLWEVSDALSGKGKKFVDQQHDVTTNDIKLAHREGYRSVEHLKRYTTLGMANDQGKTSNVNALAQMAELQQKTIENTGTTVFRPPYTPVSLGALSGIHSGFNVLPERFSPFHDVMLKYGAVNFTAGLWHRPRYFPKTINGQLETLTQSYIREADHVRNFVGVCDVGTLGKIDVQGPDSAEFLNRIYTNAWLKLPVGKARYGLMLREDGIIDDDGTATRINEHQFLLTTTTVKAADVLSNMERYLETEWTDLKVTVTSVSDQTGTLAVAGPNSRSVLEKIVADDISNESLPEMGTLVTSINDVPIRLTRLSFSGEMAYEVFVLSNNAEYIYEQIMQAGKDYNIAPYGMEALGAMRIEKGFITHAEINGTVNAKQIGYAGLCSKKKWFVGKDMLKRDGMKNAELEMVGVVPIESNTDMAIGGHFVATPEFVADGNSEGYISSMTYSPVMKTKIGLGFLKNGRSRIGEKMYIADPIRNNHYAIEIVDSVFYDKEGERTNG